MTEAILHTVYGKVHFTEKRREAKGSWQRYLQDCDPFQTSCPQSIPCSELLPRFREALRCSFNPFKAVDSRWLVKYLHLQNKANVDLLEIHQVKALEKWKGRRKWLPKVGGVKPELNEAVKWSPLEAFTSSVDVFGLRMSWHKVQQ